ncbi:MAG: PQQ-dependent sugar dehydrogenase [Rhodoblastus sp.]|uniref:PQQ-dependent sugar dehydrogenase n=1 Tax=Rhodoblastus sp. TaxID=1962975 RepID=UPI003F9AA66C
MRFKTLFLACLCLGATLHSASADHAGDVSAVLARIRLPQGFHIALYALAPEARHLAVAPDGKTIFVGTRGDKLYKVAADLNAPAKAETFAPNEKFALPSGPCFAPDGTLFVAEFDRILKFAPASGGGWDEAHPKAVVPQGKLVPPETSHGHGLRVCRVGPDGKLYVAVGQPHNVPPKDKMALYNQWGMGGIIRMNQDGSAREVFARGIRNSVGLDFNPADGVLWFTDNQVDMMGDDIPPEELNRAPRAGMNFGFPWYGGGHVRTHEYADETPPPDVVFPEVELTAHAADLGMTFYRGSQFPAEWRGVFIAQHGSWNRTVPVGARVVFVPMRGGKAGASIAFAEGWNTGKTPYLGRPVDVAELPDGSLIVSDDQQGALYRIFYDGR